MGTHGTVIVTPAKTNGSFAAGGVIRRLLSRRCAVITIRFKGDFGRLYCLCPRVSVRMRCSRGRPLNVGTFSLSSRPMSPRGVRALMSLYLEL